MSSQVRLSQKPGSDDRSALASNDLLVLDLSLRVMSSQVQHEVNDWKRPQAQRVHVVNLTNGRHSELSRVACGGYRRVVKSQIVQTCAERYRGEEKILGGSRIPERQIKVAPCGLAASSVVNITLHLVTSACNMKLFLQPQNSGHIKLFSPTSSNTIS
ncbi:hypothetical protein CDD83_9271 [Cordyceps sp. RAO-2017]|nr:hypothetical protein CDD83_9271 [Cordyceps sp. RAO-2017]